ncbi:MAG: choice-of-anchor L domain-containing protein [Tannerella sp.]|nr:choice-of-anchor L domain-containing protein [Tannerella sp.]
MFRLFYVILALLPTWSGLQAQRKATQTVKEQAPTDSLKQYYRDLGIPEELAEKRAQTVWRGQHAPQTRSSTYNPLPVPGSIWIDRDSITGAPNASHAHNFTPEEFVKDIFVKGGREIADEAIRNVTLISSTWNGSPSTTWSQHGYTGPFGGDAGTWISDDRELLYFDHGDISTMVPTWDNLGTQPYFGIEKGFLLSTGGGLYAEGNLEGNSLDMGFGGMLYTDPDWLIIGGGSAPSPADPDLSPLISEPLITLTSLEFDFRPFVDSISFKFVFASIEYKQFSNSPYNDAFGFFVSGPGLMDEWGNTGDTINIARYPDGAPISVNASNWGYRGGNGFSEYDPLGSTPVKLSPYYVLPTYSPAYNAIRPEYHVPVYDDVNQWLMEYHGHSIVLTARAKVIPGEWYHLKLAVGNASDTSLGSGVFLQAGSLDLGAPKSEIPRPYIRSNYDSIYGYSSLYSNCSNQLQITFDKQGVSGFIKVWSQGSGADYVYDSDGGTFFRDTVLYPFSATDSAVMIRFKVAENVPDGSSLFFFSQLSSSPKQDTSEVFTLYSKSAFATERFFPSTWDRPGTLEIAVTGGSPYIQRSMDEGKTWEFARDTLTGKDQPFTPLQIDRITDRKSMYILYREPNTCCSFDSIHMAVPDIVPPNIRRKVFIPEIPGAATLPGAGMHHVRSTDDFVFTVIPHPENANWILSVKTLRDPIGDDDGVIITPNPDGSYTVRVLRVQEDLHFVVNFSASLVGNEPVDPVTLRVDGNLLHVGTHRAGEIHVYSISGALIQTATPKVGETVTFRLPKGFFPVTAGGKTYKVIIR